MSATASVVCDTVFGNHLIIILLSVNATGAARYLGSGYQPPSNFSTFGRRLLLNRELVVAASRDARMFIPCGDGQDDGVLEEQHESDSWNVSGLWKSGHRENWRHGSG